MSNLLTVIRRLPEIKENADIKNFGFLSVYSEDCKVQEVLRTFTRHIDGLVDRDADRLWMHKRASRGLGQFTKGDRRTAVFPVMVETALIESMTDLMNRIIKDLEKGQYEISLELHDLLQRKQWERMNGVVF